MTRTILASLLLLLAAPLFAASPHVLEWSVQRDFDQTYQAVYAALEDNRFYIVFEPDIQKNLSGFAERWGEDYNRNQLDGIRAMVFCNGWYANQVSNQDPDMLALCPLHITLTHKDGITKILFVRPSVIARGSPAEAIATELEADVVKALEEGLAVVRR